MAQERQPFRGFARAGIEPGEERGAALLDTAAVRAARVTHIGGTTGSTPVPVVSAEAAAAILNAGTPITSSLPRVEVASEPPAPVRSVSPIEVDTAGQEGVDALQLESEPQATPAAPSASQVDTPALMASSPQEGAVLAGEPVEASAQRILEEPAVASAPPVVEEPAAAPSATEAPQPTRPASQPLAGAARVSAPAGDFEAFASTASASAPPMSRTPLGVDPELRDEPDAGAPDLEPDEPIVTGAGAAPPASVEAPEVDDSIVVLEEPVLISGGEIIRPRTMQAPVRPQPAEPSALTPNPDSRDDLARAADPAVAGQELMGLATHRRAAVRAAVAARPDLPATVVVFLSRDHSSEVLTSLLRNPRIPASTVRYLADHRDPRVADLAVQRLRNDFR
ncbi:hypothetical protein [Demequina zhanjiangensis]|uniref:Leucine rich repeat variant n=1 Tax=Demequina zhanjiangensis TaxID=3051659 RepID=A0ABT8FXQ3_9MICO|nr:hypothetical protein [Demequina sp. SYSU T00b26]MDN4471532.1 hypothetical protein [Demequina sp. SYSU T00b26]